MNGDARDKRPTSRGPNCLTEIRDCYSGVGHRTCYLWTAFKIDYRFVVEYWLERTVPAQFPNTLQGKINTPIRLRDSSSM
jgi:hypothetical protein